jgi:class 3 adenylate cyclase
VVSEWAVNLASKLGGDIAGEGEILITELLRKSLRGEHAFKIGDAREIKASGIAFPFYEVPYEVPRDTPGRSV